MAFWELWSFFWSLFGFPLYSKKTNCITTTKKKMAWLQRIEATNPTLNTNAKTFKRREHLIRKCGFPIGERPLWALFLRQGFCKLVRRGWQIWIRKSFFYRQDACRRSANSSRRFVRFVQTAGRLSNVGSTLNVCQPWILPTWEMAVLNCCENRSLQDQKFKLTKAIRARACIAQRRWGNSPERRAHAGRGSVGVKR